MNSFLHSLFICINCLEMKHFHLQLSGLHESTHTTPQMLPISFSKVGCIHCHFSHWHSRSFWTHSLSPARLIQLCLHAVVIHANSHSPMGQAFHTVWQHWYWCIHSIKLPQKGASQITYLIRFPEKGRRHHFTCQFTVK